MAHYEIKTVHNKNLKARFLQDRPCNLHLYYQFHLFTINFNSPNFILLCFSKDYELIFS